MRAKISRHVTDISIVFDAKILTRNTYYISVKPKLLKFINFSTWKCETLCQNEVRLPGDRCKNGRIKKSTGTPFSEFSAVYRILFLSDSQITTTWVHSEDRLQMVLVLNFNLAFSVL